MGRKSGLAPRDAGWVDAEWVVAEDIGVLPIQARHSPLVRHEPPFYRAAGETFMESPDRPRQDQP